MAIFRSATSWALLPVSACLAANSDQLQWFSVSTPGQSALYRSDAGLAGQDESPTILTDLCARGGSYTGIDLTYQNDEAKSGTYRWKQPSVDFALETAVEAIPGLVFGLDAIDHHPKTFATDGGSKWELFDPQGGVRVGTGVDLLRTMREKSQWRWVVTGWLPVFSQTREWEIGSGLIYSRQFRIDASARWSTPGIASRWTIPVDSVALQDTLWWRSNTSRFSLRLGGAPTPSTSFQAWGGLRRLRDPGHGTDPSWRTWGSSWFGGGQSGFSTGVLNWELEARGEAGDQSALFDGRTVFPFFLDSGIERSSIEFTIGSGRISTGIDLTKSVSATIELSGATMDLRNASLVGSVPPPIPPTNGTWATSKRFSAVLSSSIRLPWVRIEPDLGLQWLALDGDPLPLWQNLAPHGTGRFWSMPIGLRVARLGSMNGKVSYGISAEIALSEKTYSFQPGLRHHLEMKQGF